MTAVHKVPEYLIQADPGENNRRVEFCDWLYLRNEQMVQFWGITVRYGDVCKQPRLILPSSGGQLAPEGTPPPDFQTPVPGSGSQTPEAPNVVLQPTDDPDPTEDPTVIATPASSEFIVGDKVVAKYPFRFDLSSNVAHDNIYGGIPRGPDGVIETGIATRTEGFDGGVSNWAVSGVQCAPVYQEGDDWFVPLCGNSPEGPVHFRVKLEREKGASFVFNAKGLDWGNNMGWPPGDPVKDRATLFEPGKQVVFIVGACSKEDCDKILLPDDLMHQVEIRAYGPSNLAYFTAGGGRIPEGATIGWADEIAVPFIQQ